ncbi:hypothetical protein MHH60_32560 [Paenibacillus sp. FSL H7-0716]|uniref:Uncharacterized protein n=1 Tax=Paenibacillus odorifer TaxID=189426 RepID=A0AB36J528_9BACL|nr:hypothetical protein [Paenibacillus odorifer]OME10014.1 hypothetical protein BSK47_31445 [Paenibacillus odorifer]
MRHSDIVELLNEVQDILAFLDNQINVASTDTTILEISKPKVKSSLEHLRSCLDYAAHDIYDNIYRAIDGKTEEQRNRMNIYFPYGKILNDFHSSLGRSFPRLGLVNQGVYKLMKSIQPFSCQSNWLYDFCELTNKIKHVEQKKQERHPMQRITAGKFFQVEYRTKGQNSIHVSGNVINGVKQEKDINVKDGQIITSSSETDTFMKVTDFSEFIFKDTRINVFNLLKESYENINTFIKKLYVIL